MLPICLIVGSLTNGTVFLEGAVLLDSAFEDAGMFLFSSSFFPPALMMTIKTSSANIAVAILCLTNQLRRSAWQCLHFLAEAKISSPHWGHFFVCPASSLFC